MAIVRRAPSLLMPAAVAGLLGDLACNQLLGLDDWHARAGDAGATPGEGGGGRACTSNAHCIDPKSGNAAFCVTGNCVNLDLEHCLPQVLPTSIDVGNDDVALIAAFIPLKGSSPLAAPNALAFNLALEELAKADGIPGEKRRQVAMILCGSEDDLVEEAKRHVAEDLRVPFVIAGFDELGLTDWLENYAVDRQIFTLNPGVSTDALKLKNTERLLWNLLGTPEGVALAYRPLLVRTENYVRNKRPSALRDAPVKVALLSTDTATEQSVAEVLQNGPIDHTTGEKDLGKALEFNGRSTAENGKNGDFLFIQVDAIEKGETPNYSGIQAQLSAFRPDVVIALTRDEIVKIVEDYEGPNPGIDPATRPTWLLSYRNAHPQGLLAYLWTDFKQKRERFLGVQYAGASKPEQREAWLARMKAKYPDVPESSYSAVENFYDAVYWLAYGLAAAGPGAPTTGRSIREGVRTLLAGPSIYAGPVDTITAAFWRISLEPETTYVGALGPPDISEKFGTWNSVGGVYCYVQNDDGLIAPRYDVLRYNGSKGELDGVLDCFPTTGTF
jgi:hypothetical protein